MANNDFPLSGKRILILVGEIYEDLELWYPKLRLEEAGARTTIAGPAANQHYNGKHGYPCTSDTAIAAICHGGWITISAGVYRGVRVTGSPGIKDDLVNAGATYEDEAVVVDGHHISSRRPDDLPEFCRAIIQMMSSQS